jgi:archaellum biogenesis protein FlaJ (TadC family)
MGVEVNYAVVLVAGVVSIVAGAIWYVLFAKLLLKIRPLSPAEQQELQKQMKLSYGVGFLLTLVMAEVLFHMVVATESFTHAGPVANALITALFIYIGFIVPVQANHIIFGNYGALSKKIKLFAINTGGQLVSLLAMAIVIGLMK